MSPANAGRMAGTKTASAFGVGVRFPTGRAVEFGVTDAVEEGGLGVMLGTGERTTGNGLTVCADVGLGASTKRDGDAGAVGVNSLVLHAARRTRKINPLIPDRH